MGRGRLHYTSSLFVMLAALFTLGASLAVAANVGGDGDNLVVKSRRTDSVAIIRRATLSGTVTLAGVGPLSGADIHASTPPILPPARGGGGKEQLSGVWFHFLEFLSPEGTAWAGSRIISTISSSGGFYSLTLDQGVTYGLWSTHPNAFPRYLGEFTLSANRTFDFSLMPTSIYTLSGILTREDGQTVPGVSVVFESYNAGGECAPDGDVDTGCVDQFSTTSLVTPAGYFSTTLKQGLPYRITFKETTTTREKWVDQRYDGTETDIELLPPLTTLGFRPPKIIFDPANPSNLQVGSNSALFHFSTDLPATANIHYFKGSDPVSITPWTANATSHEVTLSGLSSYTDYKYKIEAVAGTSQPGCYDEPGEVQAESDCDTAQTGWPTFRTVLGPTIISPGPDLTGEDALVDRDGNGSEPVILTDVDISGSYTGWHWKEGAIVLSGPGGSGGFPYPSSPSPVTLLTNPNPHVLTLRVWNGDPITGPSDEATRNVSVLNIPIFTQPTGNPFTIIVGRNFTLPFQARDPIELVDLTVTQNTASSWLTLQGGGVNPGNPASISLAGTPTATGGPYFVTVRARNTSNRSTDKQVSITVVPNRPPAFNPSGDEAKVAGVDIPFTLLVKATDPDGDQVTVDRTDDPPTAQPGWANWLTCNPTPAIGTPTATMTCTGTPSAQGTYIAMFSAVDSQGAAAPVKLVTIKVNVPPVFTSPQTDIYSVAPGDIFPLITFTAQDTVGETMTLSVVGTPPSWISCGVTNPSGNPVSRDCNGSGAVPLTDRGSTQTLTIRATDNSGAPNSSTDKVITIYVTSFKDVSGTNLPLDTNDTNGADVGRIDGDGDLDLVLTHPYNASIGNRIWLNNGSGVFTDGTSGRLADYRSLGVRILEHPTNRRDLYFSHWIPPSGAEQRAKRMKNNGSGFFTEEFITEYCFDGVTRINWVGGYDIEGLRIPYWGNKFFVLYANNYHRETFCHPPFTPQATEWSSVFSWSDDLSVRQYHYVFNDGTLLENPRTTDFETAAIDTEANSTDVFSAGVAHYSGGALFDYSLPRVFLQNVGNGYLYNRFTFPLNWASNWTDPDGVTNRVYQKAALADLDADGDKDIAIVDIQHGLTLYKNDSGFQTVSFTYMDQNPSGLTPQETKEVAIGDLTKDGRPDILLVGANNRPEKVLVNQGSFNFTYDPTILPYTSDNSNGALIFDMDGDGDNDVFVYNKTGGNKLYRNIAP